MTDSTNGLVIIIDDDYRVREALSDLLLAAGMSAVLFASASEYINSRKVDTPACLVVDIGLGDINGLDLQDQIANEGHPPIIFITGHGDVPSSVRAMKAGAIDFLTKPFSERDLLGAIRLAIEKDREMRRIRSEQAALEARMNSLTPREREVMSLVVSGLLNKQAAAKLGISEVTLQIHRGKVMRKMKAESLADLVRMAASLKIPLCAE